MAIDYLFIACPIEGCGADIIWVVDDSDPDIAMFCVKCGKQYKLVVKRDGSEDSGSEQT